MVGGGGGHLTSSQKAGISHLMTGDLKKQCVTGGACLTQAGSISLLFQWHSPGVLT